MTRLLPTRIFRKGGREYYLFICEEARLIYYRSEDGDIYDFEEGTGNDTLSDVAKRIYDKMII